MFFSERRRFCFRTEKAGDHEAGGRLFREDMPGRGSLPLKTVCSICNKNIENTIISGVEADSRVYAVSMCGDCRVAVTVPPPSAEDLERLYYSGNYRSAGGRRFNPFIEFFIYLSRLQRKRRIKKYVKRGRILDIGCGRGLALEVMRRDGWEVAGVEFSREAAACADRQYGIHVVHGVIEEWGFQPGSFDVITIYHVLEHLEKPAQVLEECGRLLRKGGLLVCAVPDISSLQATTGKGKWFHLDVPYHIHHFTEPGLVALLTKKGFTVVKIRRMDLEHNLFGWLQTLFNISGFRKNLLYRLLKNRDLRAAERTGASRCEIIFTLLLLPFYFVLAVVLSIFESYILRRGGTVAVYAVKK